MMILQYGAIKYGVARMDKPKKRSEPTGRPIATHDKTTESTKRAARNRATAMNGNPCLPNCPSPVDGLRPDTTTPSLTWKTTSNARNSAHNET